MLFDLTIPFWLSWHKSRRFAYGAVILFHLTTALLFNIGMFPYIMVICTLVFFDFRELKDKKVAHRPEILRAVPLFLACFLAVQMLIPLRHWLYPGNVNWTEEGFRFSWRVMLVEKTGEAIFYVTDPKTEETSVVIPADYLTPIQAKQMSFQPDMIVAFARFLDDQYEEDMMVTADVRVSWNNWPNRLLIDSAADLSIADNKESIILGAAP